MSGDPPSAEEIVDALSSRDDILGALAEGPRDIRDLRDDLGCSRSTAYKAVRELQAEELVEGVDGGYQLTLLGRLLYRRYRTYLSETDDVLEHRTMLSTLPSDVPLDPSVFSNAKVIAADPLSPDEPVDALESFLADAERFRSFAPVTRSRYHLAAEELLERGVVLEMLTEREVLEFALSNHGDMMRRILEHENVTYYQTDESLPFGLMVIDEPKHRIGITLYDERKQLRGLVISEDPRAYEWSVETYRSYREGATKLTPGGDEE